MARGPTTEEQELPAYPIRAYQLIPDPNRPTVVALAIETEQGHSLFLAQCGERGLRASGNAAAAELAAAG